MVAVPFLLFALFVLGIWLAVHNLVPEILRAAEATGRLLLALAVRFPRIAALEKAWESKIRTVRSYGSVLLIVAVGVAGSIAAADAFASLAEALRENSPLMDQLDVWVWEASRLYHSRGGTAFFTMFTLLGSPVGLALVVLGVSARLLAQGRFRWMAYLIATSAGGGLLNLGLKAIFERQRPDLAAGLRHAAGHSFPSGHAMGATIVFGALTYLAIRALRTWKAKSATIAIATGFILAISFSRVYLGVHWVSDIVAGMAAGLVWMLATTLAYETVRRVRAVRAGSRRLTTRGPAADPPEAPFEDRRAR